MKKNLLAMMAVFLIATVGCSKGSEDGEKKASTTGGGGAAVAEMPFAAAAVVTGKPVVGQPAPEIEGFDTDGKAFNLSDYKGKVVMLDFWGKW